MEATTPAGLDPAAGPPGVDRITAVYLAQVPNPKGGKQQWFAFWTHQEACDFLRRHNVSRPEPIRAPLHHDSAAKQAVELPAKD